MGGGKSYKQQSKHKVMHVGPEVNGAERKQRGAKEEGDSYSIPAATAENRLF